MPSLTIIGDGDGAWPDLADKRAEDLLIHLTEGGQIAALKGGMVSGKPSIALRLDLPDGRVVFYELSLALLLSAADYFKTRYGDPRFDHFEKEVNE